jgi:hypothetical protein
MSTHKELTLPSDPAPYGTWTMQGNTSLSDLLPSIIARLGDPSTNQLADVESLKALLAAMTRKGVDVVTHSPSSQDIGTEAKNVPVLSFNRTNESHGDQAHGVSSP